MRTVNGIGTTVYGRAKRQELYDEQRSEAEAAGYSPETYQVVKWFVIVFLPVIPLGTFRVMRVKQSFWTLESPKWALQPVKWDWAQIARHYLLTYGALFIGIWLLGSIIG